MSNWIKEIRNVLGTTTLIIPSAGGWIEDDRGRILLQKRSAINEQWGFPGGIVDIGESAAETAVREIFEETGLITVAEDLLGIYSNYFLTLENGDKCQSFGVFFRMRVVSGKLTVDNRETHALEYFSVESLPPLSYQQHNDFIEDMKNGNIPGFR